MKLVGPCSFSMKCCTRYQKDTLAMMITSRLCRCRNFVFEAGSTYLAEPGGGMWRTTVEHQPIKQSYKWGGEPSQEV